MTNEKIADKAGKNGDGQRATRAESIHTIYRGPHIGRNRCGAMDWYARKARSHHLTNIHHLSERPPKLFKGEAMDISFTEEDAKWVHHPHSDALVINVYIGSRSVHRILVDNGSSANILYYDVYKKMGLLDKEMSIDICYLYGFTGVTVSTKRSIKLSIRLGDSAASAT